MGSSAGWGATAAMSGEYHAIPSSFGRATEEGNLLGLHPTVKPVAMVADAIIDCSGRGDPVPIASSAVAPAYRRGAAGRRAGIEIDSAYIDRIIDRWEAHCGGRARHAGDGPDLPGARDWAGDAHIQ